MIIVLATLLVVALVPVAVSAAGGQFTDDDDSIFEDHIEWLASAGVTAGCNPPTNDNFCPDDNVSRGQMAAFMRRFAQYIGAEDGTPAEADHATTADTATSATSADNAGTVDGKNAIQFQPTTNSFATGDLSVSSNGTHTVVEASVTTTDGSGLFCLIGSTHTADIRVHASGAVAGLTDGESATFLLQDSNGNITGTERFVYDSEGSFAIEWLYELVPGGTETFELVATEASGDAYTVIDATILVEVLSDTRCKGTGLIVLPSKPNSAGPDAIDS
jgi:hypothetical protein